MLSYEGRNRNAANYLKAAQFDRPQWIPCSVSLLPATWMKYRESLEELVLAHPKVFPGYRRGSRDFDWVPGPLYELGERTDCWGVVWRNIERGMDSQAVVHPLEDWSALDSYRAPDPLRDDLFGPRQDWGELARSFERAKSAGDIAAAGPLPHGFFFMRLYYLRGFENLMLDMATEEPRLERLIKLVEDYDAKVIAKTVELGAEFIYLGEDLGMQHSLPISPQMWRKYVKPSYEVMLKPCRERQLPVYLHSDGHILEIIPDLIECGVRVINPQVRANGLEGLKEVAKGKVAINLDLDRQMFPFATPSQLEDHIGEAIEVLDSPDGGLMLVAECAPDVPLENIEAICSAFERLCRLPEP